MWPRGPAAAQAEGCEWAQLPKVGRVWGARRAARGRGAAGPLLSALLSVVWLLYGNDHDVAVPSVFL